jgi:hypothetical protein
MSGGSASVAEPAMRTDIFADVGRLTDQNEPQPHPQPQQVQRLAGRAMPRAETVAEAAARSRLRASSSFRFSRSSSGPASFALGLRTEMGRGFLHHCHAPHRQVREFPQRHGRYGRVVDRIGTGRGEFGQGRSKKTPQKRKSRGEPPRLEIAGKISLKRAKEDGEVRSLSLVWLK